ncbi:hypothetical protein ACTFIW_009315 [Dictyostelium discoideum]
MSQQTTAATPATTAAPATTAIPVKISKCLHIGCEKKMCNSESAVLDPNQNKCSDCGAVVLNKNMDRHKTLNCIISKNLDIDMDERNEYSYEYLPINTEVDYEALQEALKGLPLAYQKSILKSLPSLDKSQFEIDNKQFVDKLDKEFDTLIIGEHSKDCSGVFTKLSGNRGLFKKLIVDNSLVNIIISRYEPISS